MGGVSEIEVQEVFELVRQAVVVEVASGVGQGSGGKVVGSFEAVGPLGVGVVCRKIGAAANGERREGRAAVCDLEGEAMEAFVGEGELTVYQGFGCLKGVGRVESVAGVDEDGAIICVDEHVTRAEVGGELDGCGAG